MSIDTVVLDKPKRSVMKNVYGHSSTYPCEYCESPACPYRNQEAVEAIKKKYESQRNQMNAQIDSLRNQPGSSAAIVRNEESIAALQNALIQLEREEKSELKKHRTQLTWPASTMNGRPRTVTSIRRIVNDIEESELPLDKHYVKGIKGRSVLMDQPNFDMITDSPCEYMHSVCLGAVKRLVELSFKVGENRSRITTRKLSCPTLYNNLIKDVRVPREFSRRCRKLDLSVFKAQDFRNLLLFFFPIVLSCIPQKNKKEIQLWLCLVYIIRACILPQQEYEKVSQHTLFELCELFYNLFEELFGPQNCTYSIQVVSSHILKIRGHVPLTERSAFMFESYYSEMKNLFQPGTQAPLKQILKNTIMKRSVEYHACAKSVHYTTEKNNLENNHGVYTLDNDNNHLLHNIVEVNNETGSFTCVRQGKFKYCNDLLPNSNWSHVGVYKLGPTGCETYTVAKKDVCGKVLTVNNMLITCPINVLLEN